MTTVAELVASDVLTYAGSIALIDRATVKVGLYCWPCRTVHALPLGDVEKIVYALGKVEVLALELGGDEGLTTECAELAAAGPSCLAKVLECARDGAAYREHVEQGVTCREASDA